MKEMKILIAFYIFYIFAGLVWFAFVSLIILAGFISAIGSFS